MGNWYSVLRTAGMTESDLGTVQELLNEECGVKQALGKKGVGLLMETERPASLDVQNALGLVDETRLMEPR